MMNLDEISVDTPDLKLCPFCGGTATIVTTTNANGHVYCYAHCIKCGSRTGSVVQSVKYCASQIAADLWNKRK